MRIVRIVALAALVAACARTTGQPPPAEADPERARAALATLLVENATAARLAILYRTAGSDGAVVGVGYVDAGASAEMAPVPAGEPLLLVARDPAGAELILPPRTFEMDGTWTWRIPRGSRFVRPRGSP